MCSSDLLDQELNGFGAESLGNPQYKDTKDLDAKTRDYTAFSRKYGYIEAPGDLLRPNDPATLRDLIFMITTR